MSLNASKISPFTAATAFCTPFPRYRALSPSRSSTASCAPVEAPDGTPARPREPSSSTKSTSTVGLPRLSRISRPMISTMAVMEAPGSLGPGLLQDQAAGGKGAAAVPEAASQRPIYPLDYMPDGKDGVGHENHRGAFDDRNQPTVRP